MMNSPLSSTARRRKPRGISSVEVLVALTLLSGVLAFLTPLVVAHGRLLKAQRNYRLALDELSNQLERLSTLSPSELAPALEQLTPSPLAGERLPGATLRAQLADTELGQRLTIDIGWDELPRQAAPVRLTAWIVTPADAPRDDRE